MPEVKREIDPKWRGLHSRRLGRSPLEKRIVLAWQRFNELATGPTGSYPSAVDNLLSTGDPALAPVVSDRERRVVNTVIQWLGSPVGRNFVSDYLFSPALKELLHQLRAASASELPPALEEARFQWLRRDEETGL